MCVHARVYKKTKETNNENHDFGDYLDHNMIKKKKTWHKTENLVVLLKLHDNLLTNVLHVEDLNIFFTF